MQLNHIWWNCSNSNLLIIHQKNWTKWKVNNLINGSKKKKNINKFWSNKNKNIIRNVKHWANNLKMNEKQEYGMDVSWYFFFEKYYILWCVCRECVVSIFGFQKMIRNGMGKKRESICWLIYIKQTHIIIHNIHTYQSHKELFTIFTQC